MKTQNPSIKMAVERMRLELIFSSHRAGVIYHYTTAFHMLAFYLSLRGSIQNIKLKTRFFIPSGWARRVKSMNLLVNNKILKFVI